MSVSVSILAAGQGTRMLSEKPKALHELAGLPMVRHVLDVADQLADGPLILVIGHGGDEIRRVLGKKWTYVEQTTRLGTGHALLQCEDILAGRADTVLALVGDVPLIRLNTLQRMVTHHRDAGATITVLTFLPQDPHGYGRILRDHNGGVTGIVEEKVATDAQKLIREANSGILCFEDTWLWANLKELGVSEIGEYFLTDLIAVAVDQELLVEGIPVDDPSEVIGIDDRVKLAQAGRTMRQRLNEKWMRAGVTIVDPATTYLDTRVELGTDTVIQANTHIRGATQVGHRCMIGPNSVISDCQIGDNCRVEASFAEGAVLEDDVDVGPFAHLRSGAHLARGVHMGNFGEIKKSYLGPRTKMGHFSYVGDATIGSEVNIGAGTVTCNYDGERKHKTVIGDRVFIGSDTMLVAPVEIGERSKTGAGSVVTHDVPPDSVAHGVPARVRSQTDKKQDKGT
jgi:bifunctional UDP-N-acetylglucosamine pyrophosphorylase/glucosamine-1-phosphate N-acetyltransferase